VVEALGSGPASLPGAQRGPAQASPRLTISHGTHAGQSFPLDRDLVVIGRAASANAYDIVLDDPTVSRPHAHLIRSGDTFILHDLDSANGTALNYHRLTEPRPLYDGDLIKLGHTVLLYRAVAPPLPVPETAAHPRQHPTGRALTFFSLKGGVGTTTLAVNAALRLRALTQTSVLLVDLSVERASITTHLSFDVRCTIDDLATLPTLDPDILQSVVARHPSGLHILPAPMTPKTAMKVTPELLFTLFPLFKSCYEWVVLDTACSFSALNLACFGQSDLLAVVTAPEFATLKVTQTCLEMFAELGIATERRLLCNSVYPHPQLATAAIEKALGTPVDQSIPYSAEALGAADRGKPLALTGPELPLIKALDTLLRNAVDGHDPTPTLMSPGPPGRSRKRARR
jgi:MinD-like ATPase involved in chromosome partitioning or flagellar assembly